MTIEKRMKLTPAEVASGWYATPEREARLLNLAAKAWPNREAFALYECNGVDAYVSSNDDLECVGVYCHGRALDVLESALVMLAADKPKAAAPVSPEIVICAAIRLPDGRVIRGHRHHDCIRTAVTLIDHRHSIGLEPAPWSSEMATDQGFVTSANRYVGREEGLLLQRLAGIESVAEGGYHRRDLFSEDLY